MIEQMPKNEAIWAYCHSVFPGRQLAPRKRAHKGGYYSVLWKTR
jgi:hypothetical protein